MLSRSSRLPASLGIPNPSLAPPKARYICLQCRYRASHQQAPSRRPQTTPYSTPSLQRTYATGPIEKIQDAVTRGIGKRLFKKGEGPPLEGNVGQAQDEKTEPSTTQDTVPAVDDSDYTPAVSGEELETIGGPTGWWEEAWDAEHQFQGVNHRFIPPVPEQNSAKIQSAIERALVESVIVRQEQHSRLQLAIERARRQTKTLKPKIKRSQLRSIVVNFPRPSDVPAVKDFRLCQTGDGEFRLEWKRPEDREEMIKFLEMSLEASMEAKQKDEESGGLMAENDMGSQKEEAALSQPENDEPVATANASTADADEPQVHGDWQSPEVADAKTEQVSGGYSDRKGLPNSNPDGAPLEELDTKFFSGLQEPIYFRDPELKFAVIKRVMHLTGIRISDPTIQSIKSSRDLFHELVRKPKPKKLAQILLDVPERSQKKRKDKAPLLKSLPNVKVLPSKLRPSMMESALGRQKVIEKRLEEHGLEEPWMKESWKDTMEQLEAYERRRLMRHRSNVGSEPGRGVREGVTEPDAIDAAIMEGKALDREARA
ncbi:MAG: hypothetical protein LQ338_006738 [Usnochroma carphineum]|nr:MAG: hypothetical protein LQ338_006738 [Usnochroma carphineum]